MMSEKAEIQKQLQKRRSTMCVGFFSQCTEEEKVFPFSQERTIKPWNSMENLDSPVINVSKAEGRHKPIKTINVNVGGKVFHIPKQSAMRYPRTRIGSLALCTDPVRQLTLCDDYSVHKKEFFFDRDPAFFHHIFHFYTSGVLWVVRELCPINFEEEMEYWGMSLNDTQRCCRILFEEKVDELRDYLKVEKELIAEIRVRHYGDGYKNMVLGTFRKTIWNLVENPYSSTWAKAFAILSSLFVLISIVAMTLDTVKDLQMYTIHGKTYMEWVEISSILFFTFEYLIRITTTCDIKRFLKSTLNLLDFVAAVPYFFQLILFEALGYGGDLKSQGDLGAVGRVSDAGCVLKIIKLMQIFRVLKLARHSTGMRAFGFTLRQCYHQVCCLFLFIAMGICTFAALLFSFERDTEGSPFSSIPDAWWWAAVSISTVGYGDVVPVSVGARCVAFVCISFGIILNGMPISILFNKFSDYYAKLKGQEYTSSCLQRRFLLKSRLRHKMDMCFHPSDEDSYGDGRYECPH